MVRFGKTGWQVSPVGFGGYRINDRQPEHREALRLALLGGCNLVDTAANYGEGASELLIGQVLGELTAEKKLLREHVHVVTKAGFLQGDTLRLARTREEEGRPYPEIVECGPELRHCLSPEFLEDELTRSLRRLGLTSVDLFLLHNPETFLFEGGTHSEYYARLERAFAHLEREAARGRIRYYGISSNTLANPKEAPGFTSLEAVLERAGPRFAAIEFPFNLMEPGAALEHNNGARTLLEFAREKDLGTLANRPLHARIGERQLRLADFPVHDPELTRQRILMGVDTLTRLEASFPAASGELPEELRWGHVLRRNFNRLEELDTWKNFLEFRIRPALGAASGRFAENEEEASEARASWLKEYLAAATGLFEAITHHLENHAAVDADRVNRTLIEAAPSLAAAPAATLSQKALRIYRAFPGLHCILVGMRTPAHVRDALAPQPPLSESEALHALEGAELLR
ncbi:MAG: aldo/keto reductase [Oligoflexia bacterium]|nr:aldo/keto reductase [Oligoflexia bacterium]